MKKWRLVLWATLAIVAAGGALGYRHYWLTRPVGEGPAGPPVPRQPFQAVWTTRDVLLVGIGDSVTAGFGASPGRSYFERLVRNTDDDPVEMEGLCLSAVLPNLRAENLAVSGSTSIEHLEVVRDRLAAQDPGTLGLVVMTTGGNDLIHMYGRMPPREGAMYGATLEQARPWIENFAARLGRMLDLVRERFPGGCHLFLADIYDPTDGVGDARLAGLPRWDDGLAIHQACNEVIRRAADQRAWVHRVPVYAEFLGHGIHCRQFWRDTYRPEDPHYWYAENLEDPNDRGYDAIRRLFLIEIARIADELRRPRAPAAMPVGSDGRFRGAATCRFRFSASSARQNAHAASLESRLSPGSTVAALWSGPEKRKAATSRRTPKTLCSLFGLDEGHMTPCRPIT